MSRACFIAVVLPDTVRSDERIEVATLEAVDWGDRFTIEVRPASTERAGRTLRDIALGI